MATKSLRVCLNGHRYYKSSACPVCPVCAAKDIPEKSFLAGLAEPARRALENSSINTLKQLSQLTEAELLQFHGMGPGSIPKLRVALEAAGLSFKKD